MRVITHLGEASWLDKVKSGGSQASGYDYNAPAPASKKKEESWLDKTKSSIDKMLSKTVKDTPVPKTEDQKRRSQESYMPAPSRGIDTKQSSFLPTEGMSTKTMIMIGAGVLVVIGGIAFFLNKER